MGTFIKALRKGTVASPLRADFDIAAWFGAGQPADGVDLPDLQLVLAGVLFDQKLHQLWARFERLQLRHLPPHTLRQAYVAVANRNSATLSGKADVKLAALGQQPSVYMEEIVSMKVAGSLIGGEHAVDDLLGVTVDGLHMPLRKTYDTDGRKTAKFELRDLGQAIALGQLHWSVAAVWEDCVWSDWELGSHNDRIIAFPRNKDQADARAVGHARMSVLASVMTTHAFNLWRRMPDAIRREISAARRGVQVHGSGRRMELRPIPVEPDPQVPLRSFVLRTIASEIYFQDIFAGPLPRLSGVSVGLLFSAWEVLHSLGEAVAAKMPRSGGISSLADLWQFAPRIPRAKLYRLLVEALGVRLEVARRIIDFLTFSASQQEEIWARPLIALDEEMVTPVVACLTDPNPLRMVEKWMKLGGVDLQQRGDAFEEHAREHLAVALSESSMLKGGVCRHRYNLERRESDPGDIDLIIWFGSTVLVGEAKCTLYPARASEFHNYFRTLEGAARQASRKAAGFKTQANEFWQRIAKVPPPEETRVVPFVLTNLSFGVGMSFSDVPVVDLLILERFLGDGFLERFVQFEPSGKHKAGQTLKFYNSAQEAEDVVTRYLMDPPQLEHFRAGVRRVANLVPAVGAQDVGWAVVDYDVKMEHDQLDAFRRGAIEDAKTA